MIHKLVPNYDNFLIVLRCVRKWAKARGLYGNKFGYLGGVNFNILVACVCQLYPNSSPSYLLARFFRVFTMWDWPEPVMLNRIQQPGPLLEGEWDVWSKEVYPYHLMPIITPAFPAMNSSVSVSMHTFRVIQEEIKRGNEIIMPAIAKDVHNMKWEKLFEPSDFFIKYSYYFHCRIVGSPDSDDHVSRSWLGFVESRIRKLPDILTQRLAVDHLHFYPVQFSEDGSHSYFIGFEIDYNRLREEKTIFVEKCVLEFK